MEYPKPFGLIFRVYYGAGAELLFEVDVEEFTGGLVVGAVGDLLIPLEFFDRFVLVRKGDALGGDDVSRLQAVRGSVDRKCFTENVKMFF